MKTKGFANHSEESLANSFTAPAFELTREGDLFIPFGEFRHKKGMQRFTADGARAMANAFMNPPQWVRKLWNWFTNEPLGIPVYVGHPDVPELAAQYPDRAAYGWVASLDPQAGGLLVKVKWSDQGRQMIANGLYRYHSPYWFGAQDKSGAHEISFLRSIGLTNTPNIPVPALSNDQSHGAHEPRNQNQPMNKKLLKLLGLSEDADETAFENAVTAMQGECATLRAENSTLKNSKAEADEALANARTAHENTLNEVRSGRREAREARVDAALDSIVSDGRLLPADRNAHRERIVALSNEADVTVELGKLAAADRKLKTAAQAQSRGAAPERGKMLGAMPQSQVALANALEQELQDVRKTISDPQKAYDLAWNRLRSKKPELFTNAE